MSLRVKHSTTTYQPAALDFGEQALGTNSSDIRLTIGDKNKVVIPINALQVATSNNTNVTIASWNTFLTVNPNGVMSSTVTLPLVSLYNMGQMICVKNKQDNPIEIVCSGSNTFDDSTTELTLANSAIFISNGTGVISIFSKL